MPPEYHSNSTLDMPQFQPLLLLLLLLLLSSAASAEPPPSERDALLSFLASTPHSRRLRWNSSSSACRWTGVTCDSADAAVIELRLPAIGLSGNVSSSAFSALSSLQVLSLRRNRLAGAIPDLSNLTSLRTLNLQGNLFSGSIPPAISRLNSLSRIDLSNNGLSGEIPFSLSSLTQLRLLYLENNRLSGKLPSLDLPALKFLNVSHNRLNGSIPRTLARFPASAFAGNLDLCGDPLPTCNPFFPLAPSPSPAIEPSGSSRKLSTAAIIAIAVTGGLLLLILLLLVIFLVIRRRRRRGAPPPPKQATATERSLAMGTAETVATSSTSKEEMGGRDGEKNKLVFLGNGGGYSFDLEDLLRASAEVLGKGMTGTSYKAVLEDATTVVVKRLKDVGVQRKEFEAQMEVLGKVRSHENVVPLRAYYFSKDEKLLVYDYIAAGSLSALLHGGRGSGRSPLDWDNRLRIALAAGRGLLHLHHSAALPHGNLKASNILLCPDPDAAALSDYGLNTIFTTFPAHGNRAAGYRAPEFVETRRPTFKSDVYSFGVLLLELLTGKSPTQDSLGDDGIDLPRWVQSVVREEWTAEVFDVDLTRAEGDVDLTRAEGNLEEEMMQLLQIAMSCVALLPDSRPELGNVMKMIEEIARRGDDGEDGMLNSSDDPTKGASAVPTP